MVEQQYRRLASEFPDYLELAELLTVAARTWPRFGLGLEALARLDPATLEMIKIALEE